MTILYAEPRIVAPPPLPVSRDSRTIRLESLDRSLSVQFDGRALKLLRGSEGLGEAPQDLVTSSSPDVQGASLDETRGLARPVVLPCQVSARDQATGWGLVQRIRDIVRPDTVLTPEGNFRVVCSSLSGTRELTVAYVSGLEGVDAGLPGYDRFALNLLALDPYPRARDAVSVRFSVDASTGSMTSTDPATAGPRSLGSSVVIGQNMPVTIGGGVPVWPRLDVGGPFAPLTVDASTGMQVSVPGGVSAGKTLTIITDPRYKSIRLDGALAAGMVALGSRLGSPFQPGLNNLSVAATGATDQSEIVLTWRPGWRSLW